MESLGTEAGRGLRGLRSFSGSARTEARRGLEGGYEACAPFLTRQERGLEGGLEGGLDGHVLKGGKLYNYFFINLLTI